MSQNFMDTLYYIQTLRGRQEKERQALLAQQMAPIQQTVDDVGQYSDKLQGENEQIAQTRGTLGDTRTYDDPRLNALADIGARQSMKAREDAVQKAEMQRQLEEAKIRTEHGFDQSEALLKDEDAQAVLAETGLNPRSPEFQQAVAAMRKHREDQKIRAALAGRSPQAGVQLSPEALAAIAGGKAGLPNRPTPAWAGVLNEVTKANPNYDAAKYGARAALEKSGASGKVRDSVVALNTLIHHLGQYDDAIAGLGNSAIPYVGPVLNAGKNWAGSESDPKIRAIKIPAEAAPEELLRLLLNAGSSGALEDREHARSLLSINGVPDVMHAGSRGVAKIAAGRFGPIMNQWRQNLPDVPLDSLDRKSIAILQRMGIAPEEFAHEGPATVDDFEALGSGASGPSTGAPEGAANSARAAEIQARIDRIERLLQQDGGQ